MSSATSGSCSSRVEYRTWLKSVGTGMEAEDMVRADVANVRAEKTGRDRWRVRANMGWGEEGKRADGGETKKKAEATERELDVNSCNCV